MGCGCEPEASGWQEVAHSCDELGGRVDVDNCDGVDGDILNEKRWDFIQSNNYYNFAFFVFVIEYLGDDETLGSGSGHEIKGDCNRRLQQRLGHPSYRPFQEQNQYNQLGQEWAEIFPFVCPKHHYQLLGGHQSEGSGGETKTWKAIAKKRLHTNNNNNIGNWI